MGKVLVLTSGDVNELLDFSAVCDAVAASYVAYCEKRTKLPPVVNLMLKDRHGELDVKTGYIEDNELVAVKVATGFYENVKLSLPTGAASIMLFDAQTGFLVAIIDGGDITTVRTGAAGALAARYLARKDSETALIAGAGMQGRIQAKALMQELDLDRFLIWDINYQTSQQFCCDVAFDGELIAVDDLSVAVSESDVIVTATPATEPIISAQDVRPGTHITAVGADGPGKGELDVRLVAQARLVVDCWSQARSIGELQRAAAMGLISDRPVEIGEIIARRARGRTDNEQITIFDTSGMAVQDVATAGMVYEQAIKLKRGLWIDM